MTQKKKKHFLLLQKLEFQNGAQKKLCDEISKATEKNDTRGKTKNKRKHFRIVISEN